MKNAERVDRRTALGLMVSSGLMLLAAPVGAEEPRVRGTEVFGQRCIESNGGPNREIGRFPNRGNPNSFSSQDLSF